jgi:vacuolar-type H+-ATPase subunit E/Vma4
MALQKIIDKIFSEGRDEAERILSSARREADEILNAGKKSAEEEKSRLINEATEGFKNERQRKIAIANLEIRKEVLQVRCNLMDEVFQKAAEEVKNLRTESRRLLVQNILGGFRPDTPCEILVFESDADKYTLLLSALWGVVFTKFCKVVPLTEPLGGGFLVRTQRIEIDCTYEHLIQEERQRLEQDVAKILFADI